MKSSDMDDAEPPLTEADRRAIAEIRRKLDVEFRRKLDTEFGPLEDPDHVDLADVPTGLPGGTPRRQEATTTRRLAQWARHRAVLATLLLGMLGGTVLGVTGMLSWDRYADRDRVVSDTRVPAQASRARNDAAATPPEAVDDVALLRDALEEWIEATRRGDIAAQMRFYPERVPVYYTWRDVPRDAVRAEKARVFGTASRLVIATDLPAVELAPDGLTVITRFRKRYVIEGPVIRRRGEVLQELRWTRTTAGWLIVGERDARVLRSS